MYYGRSLQIVQILVLLRVGNFFFRFGHIFLSILQYQLDKNNNSLSINIYIYMRTTIFFSPFDKYRFTMTILSNSS